LQDECGEAEAPAGPGSDRGEGHSSAEEEGHAPDGGHRRQEAAELPQEAVGEHYPGHRGGLAVSFE